ncbi:MAG: type II toxin-antitoxin system Phd/YefM family antitoxin [Actinomycetota bacterium]
MIKVGVRELRQRASELLRRVGAGETFVVTDRGRPVAVLGPLRNQRPLERLRESGDIEPGRSDLNDLPEPLKLARGQEKPSKALERLRRDER